MSFVSSVLKTVGIRRIRVGIFLEENSVQIGKVAKGVLRINGGSFRDDIENIILTLNAEYIKVNGDKHVVESIDVQNIYIPIVGTINSKEYVEVPFEFMPLYELPSSIGDNKIYIKGQVSRLNEKKLIKLVPEFQLENEAVVERGDLSKRNMSINIQPHKNVKTFLDIFQCDLGFVMKQVENRPITTKVDKFILQEFVFTPTNYFCTELDEARVSFKTFDRVLEVSISLDKRNKNIFGKIAGAMGISYSKVNINLREEDFNRGIEHIRNLLIHSVDDKIHRTYL